MECKTIIRTNLAIGIFGDAAKRLHRPTSIYDETADIGIDPYTSNDVNQDFRNYFVRISRLKLLQVLITLPAKSQDPMKIEYHNLYTHFVFTTFRRVPLIVEPIRVRIENTLPVS